MDNLIFIVLTAHYIMACLNGVEHVVWTTNSIVKYKLRKEIICINIVSWNSYSTINFTGIDYYYKIL